MARNILVIGAGLGGLATALRLVSDGYKVTIVEKYHQAGGRLNRLQKDEFTFDMAPTFFSMSYELKELEAYCNMQIPFRLIPLNPLYTINFRGNPKQYIIYKELEKLEEQFASIEPDFARKMGRYLSDAAHLFQSVEYRILKRNFDSLPEYIFEMFKVPPRHAPKILRSMWGELNHYFSAEEVKIIFSLIAFFLGSTPFDTSAIFKILTYTELEHDGYYSVSGGMYSLVTHILQKLQNAGVDIHYNTEIVNYKSNGSAVTGFVDQTGKEWRADGYVVNSDAAWFRGTILKRKGFSGRKLDKMKWTLAPFTLYLGIKGKIENLDYHNYFLGEDFQKYAQKVFKNKISLNKPYYYVNVPSKWDKTAAPEGCEALFILCPVPDLRYKPDWSDRNEIANAIINDLSARLGVNLQDRIISYTQMDPNHWQHMFNLYKGSGLSLAHNMNQMGYWRPKNVDEYFKNVFYVGASTVPGTGLPMAIISSKLVTQRINYAYENLRSK